MLVSIGGFIAIKHQNHKTGAPETLVAARDRSAGAPKASDAMISDVSFVDAAVISTAGSGYAGSAAAPPSTAASCSVYASAPGAPGGAAPANVWLAKVLSKHRVVIVGAPSSRTKTLEAERDARTREAELRARLKGSTCKCTFGNKCAHIDKCKLGLGVTKGPDVGITPEDLEFVEARAGARRRADKSSGPAKAAW